MNKIHKNLLNVRHKIYTTAVNSNRNPQEITLVAVSKQQSYLKIKDAIAAGQLNFGENYVQEGINKIQSLSCQQQLCWHFIGQLQSNKSRIVAEKFSWCHTIDRLRLAQRLSEQRPSYLPPLNVLIQINLSEEKSKSGIKLNELTKLAQAIVLMPKLLLRGIMALPSLQDSNNLSVYHLIAKVFHQLKSEYSTVDTLSLGTSHDIEAAILAGSTMIRIGRAIFGERKDLHSLI
ncbi:MAG: YggS family pyridoxal phosphate-dependent enzyme [Candidatus Dasytiphilus stammeri]